MKRKPEEELSERVDEVVFHLLDKVLFRRNYSAMLALNMHEAIYTLVEQELQRDRRRRVAAVVKESM